MAKLGSELKHDVLSAFLEKPMDCRIVMDSTCRRRTLSAVIHTIYSELETPFPFSIRAQMLHRVTCD